MHTCRQLLGSSARWKCTLPVNFKRTALVFKSEQFTVAECRYYSARKGFFSSIIDNIKEEMAKNKEMKENIKKFREEAQKLENSEALQAARRKFHAVESEASKSSEVLKDTLEGLRGRVGNVLQEAGKSELARRAGKITEDISKTAKDAAESIADKSQKIGQTSAFKTISQATEAVRAELAPRGLEGRVYRAPAALRRRVEVAAQARAVAPDGESVGLELHKDSRFHQQWEHFKNTNPYVNKLLAWRLRVERSSGARLLADRLAGALGGLFERTELSAALTELCRLDPDFSAQRFLQQCQDDIIPNVLEALVRGDLDVLRDWSHEGVYSVLAAPVLQCRRLGYRLDSRVLDVENVELLLGKIMDQGPVLVIAFQAQQTMCVRDAAGAVVEGAPDKVVRVHYVWALCRDPAEPPRQAWRLLELSASAHDQLI